jgi:hypothetical protein
MSMMAAMVGLLAALTVPGCATSGRSESLYAGWAHGPSTDPAVFPIGVWLQEPKLAGRYREAGINFYVGLWKGPTEEQLAELKKHGMRVICPWNEVGERHRNDPTIMGWMHVDEPDNAQSMKTFWKDDVAAIRRAWPDAPERTLEQWGSYGPPIPPSQIVADYERLRIADPTRPVFVNFGQSVAWDGSRQRGVRRGHLEDYAAYLKGCDIASFDIYPGLHENPDVAGRLELTPLGVERLRQWSGDRKIVWNVIEAAHTVGRSPKKATPEQVRTQVWMSIIRGSRGIVYIVHQFAPEFVEAGLFNNTPEDRAMLEAVTKLNREIQSLAPVLNSPTVEGEIAMESDGLIEFMPSGVPFPPRPDPVKMLAKRHGGWLYVLMASDNSQGATAKLKFPGLPLPATLERFSDGKWQPWGKLDTTGEFHCEMDGYWVVIFRLADPSVR